MIRKTLMHFGLLGMFLGAGLAVTAVPAESQDAYRGRRGDHYQQNYRNGRREWRQYDRRERHLWNRYDRDWHSRGWRDDRWDRRYRRDYDRGNSRYFGRPY